MAGTSATTKIYRHSAANMLGGVIPAIISLLTIPFIVHRLGDVNYGILTMITAIIGYFSIVDLNLTAGTVKYIAEHSARQQRDELNQSVSFGAVMYIVIGLIGMIILYFGADLAIQRLFEVPKALVPLATDSLKLAAVGFLLGQAQLYAQSVPQALLRYDLSAKLEVAFGTFVPLGTVALLAVGYGLYEVILLRVAASAVNLALLVVVIRQLLPEFRLHWPSRNTAKKIAGFSGYAYLNRIAGMTYAHGDKMVIGAIAGMQALTLYVIPFTLASRLFGMTSRLGSVIFPVASSLQARNELATLERLYFHAARYVFFINCFLALLLTLFARETLRHWLGPAFNEQGATILQLVALATLVDSTTNIPSLVNDGLGHPKITGTFAILRALLGIGLSITFVTLYGALGAAIAMLLSCSLLPAFFLIYVHGRTVPFSLGRLIRHAFTGPLVAGGMLFVAFQLLKPFVGATLINTLLLAGGVSLLYALYGYRFVVIPEHRDRALRYLKSWAHRTA